MEGSVLIFLKAEWKMSDTGSAHWASTFTIILFRKGAQIPKFGIFERFTSLMLFVFFELIELRASCSMSTYFRDKVNQTNFKLQNVVFYIFHIILVKIFAKWLSLSVIEMTQIQWVKQNTASTKILSTLPLSTCCTCPSPLFFIATCISYFFCIISVSLVSFGPATYTTNCWGRSND